MKQLICLSALALVLAAATAAAADLSPVPVVRAPVPVAYYNWSGLYVGGNVGGNWAKASGTTSDAITGAFVTTDAKTSSGVLGGFQIGFNWQLNPYWMAGVEGDFDFAGNSSSVTSPDGSNSHDGKLKYISTGRGRIGAVWDNWLWYATGGVAWTQATDTRTQLTGTIHSATPGTVESITNNRIGWTIGSGVEVGFAPNWTARLEYLFLAMGSINSTFPLAARTTSQDLNISVVRAAINYKFDWATPVFARY